MVSKESRVAITDVLQASTPKDNVVFIAWQTNVADAWSHALSAAAGQELQVAQ